MPFILRLEIPAQKATLNKKRLVVPVSFYKNGNILLNGIDGELPRYFTITPKDNFPWNDFFKKLFFVWQHFEYTDLPREFRPLKRIPQIILDNFFEETLENQKKIMAELRKQKFFSPLSIEK